MDALQITPHNQRGEARAFCPSFYPNTRHEGPDHMNGLAYIRRDDEPVQVYADRPYFWIKTQGYWVAGNLWDWIVVGPTEHGDEFFIVPDHIYQRYHA